MAHDLPIQVNDPNVVMRLVYIDDVVEELIVALPGKEHKECDFCYVPTIHTITLGEILDADFVLLPPSFKKTFGTKWFSIESVGDSPRAIRFP